jgi:hypothetical protein
VYEMNDSHVRLHPFGRARAREPLRDRQVVPRVSRSIACYKAADIASRLCRRVPVWTWL